MSKFRLIVCLFLCVFMSLNTGCGVVPKTHYLQSVLHQHSPVTHIESQQGYVIEKNRTFTVVPASLFEADREHIAGTYDEQHMLFTLRNMLEGRGYRYVPVDASPDLVATVDGYSEYMKTLNNPVIRIASRWSISDVFRLKQPLNGLSYYAKLDKSNYEWGDFTDNSQIASIDDATEIANQLQDKFNYPHLRISIFDANSKQLVWSGLASGVTKSSEFKIASQLLFRTLLGNVKLSNYREDSFPRRTGKIGIGYVVTSINGRAYYPMVTGIVVDGVAYQEGIMVGDIITKINGLTTMNIPAGEVSDRLSGDACTILNLQIKRGPEIFNRAITRDWRSPQSVSRYIKQNHNGLPKTTSSYLLHPEYIGLAEALTAESKIQLDKVFNEIDTHHIVKIQVVGYTDSRRLSNKSKRYYRDNKDLSFARAKRVSEHLIRLLDLHEQQIIVEGKGADEPISSNRTSRGRAQNRRIEITVTHLTDLVSNSSCKI